MKNARIFLETPGATAEQNQNYIASSNQFTAEGEFTAEELAELLLIRAIIFSRLKDNENALESYSAALQSGNLPPILIAETLKNRGLLYYANITYAEAKNDFMQALNILSGNAELHYYLANSHFGLFEFDQAINQYDLALEGMANNRFLAFYGKASVYYQQQLYDKSKENLLKSLEVRASFEPANSLLAEINAQNNSNDSIVNDTTSIDSDKPLTSNEIYNQLLEKAYAAKNSNGGSKQMNIKLDFPNEKPKLNVQVSNKPFLLTPNIQTKRLDNLLVSNKSSEPSKLKGYYLQLSSGNDKKSAQTYYNHMIEKHKLLLAQRPYIIRKFKTSDKTTKYQLLISGFQSYKQANSLCKSLKAQDSDCFVRHIK